MAGQVLRIALTGGPFAGKTEAWKVLRELPGVLSIRETADSLYDCGFPRPIDVRMEYDEWMLTLRRYFVPARAQMQLALEEALLIQAERVQSRAIVSDRTVLDGILYYEDVAGFAADTKLDVHKALARYDIVFFFETMVLYRDLEEYTRRMPAELTREAHFKLQSLWCEHPGYRYVPTFETLAEKLDFMRNSVSELLERELR